jgi:hypothetical protein
MFWEEKKRRRLTAGATSIHKQAIDENLPIQPRSIDKRSQAEVSMPSRPNLRQRIKWGDPQIEWKEFMRWKVGSRRVNFSSLKTFVCLSSVEIDTGDRVLLADPLNDIRTEPDDGLPLRSAEWRSMRASYFAELLQFFLNRIGLL